MPATRLPFELKAWQGEGHQEAACPVCRALPEPLRSEAASHPYLLRYLHSLPVEECGIPQFHQRLERKMGETGLPNVLYPIGNGIFIHILGDPQDARNFYIPIEPVMEMDEMRPLLEALEDRLVDVVTKLPHAQTLEDRRQVLEEAMRRVVVLNGHRPHNGNGRHSLNGNGRHSLNGNGRLRLLGGNNHKLHLRAEEFEALRYLVLRDKVGLGVLQPFILDPYIEDVSCSGLGPIFIEHKIFKALKSAIAFEEEADLDTFLRRLSERIGKPVTHRRPIVDATLPDGSRINIVYGSEVSKRGSNFTIRKFATKPMSVLDLAEGGSLDYRILAYLSIVLEEGMNLFVSGETASGKTTLLNAITTFIPPEFKIVTIEDTPELQVPHPNWTREVVRGTGEEGAAVSMFDLLKAALRQRPNAILVGEIRGEEGNIAFQAMQTGHQVMATFHAATVEKLIQRITAPPINVPKTYVDNLNVVVITSAVRLKTGKLARRVLSVSEVLGYDPATESFAFAEIFHWDPVYDRFEFTGYMNSYLLENKIAVRRGLPASKRREMYLELEKRARLLQELHRKGVKDFHDLYQVLAKARRQGLF
ncbi:MAG: type II/IV secretion system ATPase subunit [Dehalococcoidia bacterium]|jgi:flagellar protein FlaI|nr:type II/IV secretion system ATPase subunit [Dehalococcoidia bacterium]MDW8009611.1 type II/IV secretion system ATPase subunit [Chloroflexota bacterium]